MAVYGVCHSEFKQSYDTNRKSSLLCFQVCWERNMDITKLPIKRKYKWMMLLFSEHSTLLLFVKVMLKAMKTNRAAYTATD